MMHSGKVRKIVLFLAVVLLLGATIAFSYHRDHITCMGVEILTETDLERFTEYSHRDVAKDLIFNGEPAAVDVESCTIYIPQDLTESSTPQNLPGQLRLDIARYQIYFAPDEYFQDLPAAAEDGHRFRLYVTNGSRKYMTYDVIFTTLPVMRIDGEFLREKDSWRDYMFGPLCVWHPADPDLGRYSIKTSYAEWSIRGGWSVVMDKHSWRISLKNENRGQSELALVGQGEDDDWILNPMSLDDTLVKEKLAMHMWNKLAETSEWNQKMSMGEYIEVVINGSYEGVYLLQRRVEKSYLDLTDDDILLKGIAFYDGNNQPSDALEIIYSPWDDTDTYEFAYDAWTCNNVENMSLGNFIDFQLFIQFLNAQDNCGYKNTYYVLKKTDEGYSTSLLPWDTDMSFGVVWGTDNFIYDKDSVNLDAIRMEYYSFAQEYSDLESIMARRWGILKESIYSNEYLQEVVKQLVMQLERSGALERDLQRWGLVYGGEDSIENLNRYLEVRQQWMNEKYAIAG